MSFPQRRSDAKLAQYSGKGSGQTAFFGTFLLKATGPAYSHAREGLPRRRFSALIPVVSCYFNGPRLTVGAADTEVDITGR